MDGMMKSAILISLALTDFDFHLEWAITRKLFGQLLDLLVVEQSRTKEGDGSITILYATMDQLVTSWGEKCTPGARHVQLVPQGPPAHKSILVFVLVNLSCLGSTLNPGF